MRESALEKELSRKCMELKFSMQAYDRGVLFGFLLALLPVFPVAFFGLLISALNYFLWKRGKLDLHDRKLIVYGLALGVINTILGLLVLTFVVSAFSHVDVTSVPAMLRDYLDGIAEWIRSQGPTKAREGLRV